MVSQIRGAPEVVRELLDHLDVAVYGSLSVITTLEFFEHPFAKVGHRLAPYDPTLSLTQVLLTLHTRKRLSQSGFVQAGLGEINDATRKDRFYGRWVGALRGTL